MPIDKFGRMDDVKPSDDGASLTYINNNFLRKDGTTEVTGSINMNGNTLTRVSNPVNPQDVATKDYVDNVSDTPLLKENGRYISTAPINMAFKSIHNLPTPEERSDAATKNYVDSRMSDINTLPNKPVTKAQLDEKIELIRNLLPFVKSGNIYEWFGEINMSQQRIFNLPSPINGHEVATKEYVDGRVKKQATTIYAEARGGLAIGERPFTFCRNSDNPIGYVIPSNAQILKGCIRVSNLTNTRFAIEILINGVGTGKELLHIGSEYSSTIYFDRSKYLVLDEEDTIGFEVKTNNPNVRFTNVSLLIELDFYI